MTTKHLGLALSSTLFFILILTAWHANANQVDTSWEAPTVNADGTPLTDLAGYNLYYWQPSWLAPIVINVGNQTTYTLSDLEAGQTYNFAVSAYDTSGNESIQSQEVDVTIPPLVIDTDNDGLTDDEEHTWETDPTNPDTDADGLLDGEEVHTYMTDPLVTDTDDDSFSDGDEIAAGTNPLDPDSQPTIQLSGHLERNEVVVNHNWQRVAFQKPFEHPIVVATSLSINDSQPAVVRLRNVDPTGFEIRVQEWDYLNDKHKNEKIGYLVLEQGHYILDDGTRVEAGQFETDLTSAFGTVTFTHAFNTVPVIFTSVITEHETDAVTGQIHNISRGDFEYRMHEQERNFQTHAMETVSYIAWEPSIGILDGVTFEVAIVPDDVTDQRHNLLFLTAFQDSPVFVAAMQSTNEEDSATVRWQNKNAFGIDVQIAEEQSVDHEQTHAPEVIGYIVFSTN
jgi:hypothetical protein